MVPLKHVGLAKVADAVIVGLTMMADWAVSVQVPFVERSEMMYIPGVLKVRVGLSSVEKGVMFSNQFWPMAPPVVVLLKVRLAP